MAIRRLRFVHKNDIFLSDLPAKAIQLTEVKQLYVPPFDNKPILCGETYYMLKTAIMLWCYCPHNQQIDGGPQVAFSADVGYMARRY